MTQGSIAKNLITFSIPLVLGNAFQLAYNAVDSMIVGRFAGDAALAAVGTADPVMNLLILFITGTCMGASVLMSGSFGAKRSKALRRELANLLLLGLAMSALIFGAGFALSRPIFALMQVPDEILGEALAYLRIVLAGMPFTCAYNIYAAALRSIGDSRTPVIFLAASSLANVALDLLFVAAFHWRAAGAAAATVIANLLSAAACAIYTNRRVDALRIARADIRPDQRTLRDILKYGGATALQQCSQPLGKLFIQGMVNALGVSTIAAFNAVGKIEDFALVPERSIANAMMTFTAQNMGANEKERARRGLWRGMLLELVYFAFICLFVLLLHGPLLSMFSAEATTLSEGARYFRVMAFFYWLPAVTNGMQGFFRGVKHMKVTIALTCVQISFRVLVTWLLIGKLGITGIAYACATGWIAMLVVGTVYFRRKVRGELE